MSFSWYFAIWVSSNINEVIRAVLNFFFHDKILHAQKNIKRIQGTKKYQKAQKYNQTKAQNANKWINKWKKVTYSLIYEEKSLQ